MGSSSGKSCESFYEPYNNINKKISSLGETDFVKLEKLRLETVKQIQNDNKNGGAEAQIEILKMEYAIKGEESKYKKCLQAEKDASKWLKSADEKTKKIEEKWAESGASKDANKWKTEFNR